MKLQIVTYLKSDLMYAHGTMNDILEISPDPPPKNKQQLPNYNKYIGGALLLA